MQRERFDVPVILNRVKLQLFSTERSRLPFPVKRMVEEIVSLNGSVDPSDRPDSRHL
jgi:hypothetical protein